MQRRKLEELNLLDDFLFHAMLAYPDTGEAFIRKLLETLFDRKFPHLKIRAQESFAGVNTDFRGARLDVYIEEDGSAQINGDEIPTVYDVEPDHNHKNAEIKAFPKRARFYHAMIDRRSLKAGEHFGKMKKVYVIFICDYDPFGYDRVLYTIKNRCLEEPTMPYEDDAETWVLYTRGKKGNISESLRQLLSYMENTNQNNAINEDLRDIQQMVDQVKRDGEVSLRYMKWFEHDQMMYEEGREQGRKDAQESAERERKIAEQERKNAERERQIAEQEKKRAKVAEQLAETAKQEVKDAKRKEELTKQLLADERLEDLKRALDDPVFRDCLLKEYGIN
ncbi:Rpn family recombination-promoting nuclease/putative transposase [Oscillospiraceae bacterium Marseille-Q3528]|nr:Rpn family recombination-promoting nuclease/putative transposase [Oscillospiraceae bacterium Marseille-Q3528]